MVYLLHVSLVLTLLYAVYRIALRSDTAFRRNRAYLLGALTASWGLPFLEFPLASDAPVWQTQLVLEPLVVRASNRLATEVPWLLLVYGAGVVVGLFRFGGRLYRILQLAHSYVPQRFAGVLLIRTHAVSTSSFGRYLFWHPDPNLSAEQTRRLLRHECAHIHQRHTYDVLFSEVVLILLWFHPAAYLWQRALRDQHEFLADLAAAPPAERSLYRRQLARAYLEANGLGLALGFRSRQLHRRLQMLRREASHRWSHLKVLLAVPLVAVCGVSYPDLRPQSRALDPKEVSPTDETHHAYPAGGWKAFYARYQAELLKAEAIGSYTQSTQFLVVFTISPAGELDWVGVHNTPNEAVGRAAVQTLYSLQTRWEPSRKAGTSIPGKFTLPISLN